MRAGSGFLQARRRWLGAGLTAVLVFACALSGRGAPAEAGPSPVGGGSGPAAKVEQLQHLKAGRAQFLGAVRPAEVREAASAVGRVQGILRRAPSTLAGQSAAAGLQAAGGPVTALGGPSPFTVMAGWNGMSFVNLTPPDVSVATGPRHVVETVNTTMEIWDKTGAHIAGPTSLGGLFGVGPYFAFDPKVTYDRESGRFFMVLVGKYGNTGRVWLAASQTSDPTGPWSTWVLGTTPGHLPDYPGLGFASDKVMVTANAYSLPSDAYMGIEWWAVNKADLVAGAAAPATVYYGIDNRFFTVQPAESQSHTTTQYMTDDWASTMHLWSIYGEPGVTPVTGTITSFAVRTFVNPPDARQPGSYPPIDSGDARLERTTWRTGSLWTAATVGCIPAGDTALRSCARLIQVDTSAMSVHQDFDFGKAGYDYFYPAMQTDVNGNLAVVFSRSAPNEYAGVHYAGRRAADPLNTLSDSVLLKPGTGPFYCDFCGSRNRWGDYSGAAVDPNGRDLWVAGEYSATANTTARNWSTWIARVRIPFTRPVIAWHLPIDPTIRFTWPRGQVLPIAFGYFDDAGQFLHNESVVIQVQDLANPDYPVATWTYQNQIDIDDLAEAYSQEFDPSPYGLAPGASLAIQIYMDGELTDQVMVTISN